MSLKSFIFSLMSFLFVATPQAKEVTDTLLTTSGDRMILRYAVAPEGEGYTLKFSTTPRIIPSASSKLRKESKGSLDRLKVVIFDRVGDFGATEWKGLTPKAFIKPAGLSYDDSKDGFYILGQSAPLTFKAETSDAVTVSFPIFIALYEKKQNYKLLTQSAGPLTVKFAPSKASKSATSTSTGSHTESVTVSFQMELEADNTDITNALQSIEMVNQMLAMTTEGSFSQSLQMELMNLRMMKSKITDPDLLGKINEVLLAASQKEKELAQAQANDEATAKAIEQANLAQQKKEEQERQAAAQEEARFQEEKQQKRTMWLIIGGVLLAVVGFVGNAIFRHFSELNNKKSILEMQESLTKQAESEAKRRSREIIRNKAHQAMNKGKNQLRAKAQESQKAKQADPQQPTNPSSNRSTRSSSTNNKTRRTI